MPDELHSSLSPSGRHRWGACPGSVRLEAPYPEDKAGPAALDGTRTHTLLERLVRYEFIDKKGQCGPLPMWNTNHTDDFGSFTVDADRAARLNVALEYVRDFVSENGGTVIAEQRVYPDGLVGRADMDGTVDIQIANKYTYAIVDYKDGVSPVEAKRNPQLEMYALGVLAGLVPENYPKKFLLVIIQPKLKMKGLPVISSWDVSVPELLCIAEIAKQQAAQTEDPNAPLIPGTEQCKYCKAKGSCPALANKAMEGIGAMFSPVMPVAPVPGFIAPNNPFAPKPLVPVVVTDEGDHWKASPLSDPRWVNANPATIEPEVIPAGVPDMAQVLASRDPHKMSLDQLRQVMEAAPLVRQLLEGVHKEVERRLHAGEKVPGFKLVVGKGSREWALPEEEMVKKLTGMQIPKSALYKQTLISPAQAEKLVWDKKGEVSSLSDLQKKRMETEYIKKNPGAPVVVPESDSRPAIVRDASPLFSPVPSFLQAPKPSFLP